LSRTVRPPRLRRKSLIRLLWRHAPDFRTTRIFAEIDAD